MEPWKRSRPEIRPAAIVVTDVRATREEITTTTAASLTPDSARTPRTPNLDARFEDPATTSPRQRIYMDGDRLGVDGTWQGSRRDSQNSQITATTSPSSAGDSFIFEPGQDYVSTRTERNELAYYTDASSPAYGHEQIFCVRDAPTQDFASSVLAHDWPRGGIGSGSDVRLGVHMADHLVNGAFTSGEIPSIHVAVPEHPQEYLDYGSIDSTIPLMVNVDPLDTCYIELHKLTWAQKSEPMPGPVHYLNHAGDGLQSNSFSPNLPNAPNAPDILLMGNQIMNQGQRPPSAQGGVQLNGEVLLPTAQSPQLVSNRVTPQPKDIHKRAMPAAHMPASSSVLVDGAQNQQHKQANKDASTRKMKPPPLDNLKREAADRSDFQTPKRLRAGGGPDENSEVIDDIDSNSPTWACPFFRHDPLGNMNCLKLKLKRIRDVKQHIQRRHNKSGNYCQKCWESFPNRKKKEEHLNLDNCEPIDQSLSVKKGGISAEAQEKLKHRAQRSKSGDQQWHDVYDIVFKGQQGPDRSSLEPQLGTFILETTRLMQSFWRDENEDWFPGYLSKQPLAQNMNQDALQNLVVNLMEEIHTRFEERIRGSSPPNRWDNIAVPAIEAPPSAMVSPTTAFATTDNSQDVSLIGCHLQNEMIQRPSEICDADNAFLYLVDHDYSLANYGLQFHEADDLIENAYDMGG
ncbi:unnamed protein product [Clonostachys rosea]|uniref:C2H2-type domain-containing protein n=1 Tax=Bionectria ochroleuca TaxID=29856 RepID=A0ABY6UI71_BIOOC|nr:unnamed protein product [Clonostachys rosea]